MTVRRLFFGAKQPGGDLERRGQLDELREALGKELGKARWKVVAKEIGRQVAGVLDFGIAEKVLAPAWQRLEMLQEYRDPSLHPPGESALVPLFKHAVRSTHAPHIDLLFKEVEIGRLALEVDLSIELEGVMLRIQDARICGLEGGSAKGGGSLACSYGGKSVYSLKRDSRTFSLAAGVGFANGIPIPPAL